ncbi:MAG: hypothetical protein WDN72_09640 [Alphaproteobacteria bacterium]
MKVICGSWGRDLVDDVVEYRLVAVMRDEYRAVDHRDGVNDEQHRGEGDEDEAVAQPGAPRGVAHGAVRPPPSGTSR